MAQITEDYVSFEIAKLLKEKGFNEYCYGYYYTSKYITHGDFKQKNLELFPDSYSAPTLQMAMKWLREVHHIFIRVIQSHIEYCTCEIYYNIVRHYEFRESFNSYEEACEKAIEYCLKNLI